MPRRGQYSKRAFQKAKAKAPKLTHDYEPDFSINVDAPGMRRGDYTAYVQPDVTRTRDVRVPRGMPNYGGPEIPVTKRLKAPKMAPTGKVRIGRKKGSPWPPMGPKA